MTNDADRSRPATAPGAPLSDDELDLALPFYAIGKLPPQEMQAVAARLANDSGARRRLELVGEERRETEALNAAIAPPSLAAMERLFARIDAEEAPVEAAARQKPVAGQGQGGLLARLFGPRGRAAAHGAAPRAWGFAVAALAVIAIIQSGLLLQLLSRTAPQAPYVTASAPEAPGAARSGASPTGASPTGVNQTGAAHAMVRLQPGVSMSEVEAWLTANQLRIVDGPRPGGLWRIQAASGDAAALVSRLQAAQQLFAVTLPE